MKKLLVIILIVANFPLYGQSNYDYIKTQHGSIIWLVNKNGLDSVALPLFNLTGFATYGMIDSLAVVKLALKAPVNNAVFTGTFSAPNLSGSNTGDNAVNTLYSGLAASKQNTITVLPFANGGITGSAATSATTGTMTVSMTTRVITITPTGACTFNASGGIAGQMVTFIVTTSGVSSFVITFGTNFRKVGTLATGTVSARFFAVTFICLSDNGIWQEVSRTAVQT